MKTTKLNKASGKGGGRFINYANLQPSERPERKRGFEVAADRASVSLSSHRGASPRKETATKAPRSLDCFECLPLRSRCYLFISLSVTGDSVSRKKKKKRERLTAHAEGEKKRVSRNSETSTRSYKTSPHTARGVPRPSALQGQKASPSLWGSSDCNFTSAASVGGGEIQTESISTGGLLTSRECKVYISQRSQQRDSVVLLERVSQLCRICFAAEPSR